MRTINFEWVYEDYLAVTNRENTKANQERWLEMVALLNTKYYESIDEEISSTIRWVDSEIIKGGE